MPIARRQLYAKLAWDSRRLSLRRPTRPRATEPIVEAMIRDERKARIAVVRHWHLVVLSAARSSGRRGAETEVAIRSAAAASIGEERSDAAVSIDARRGGVDRLGYQMAGEGSSRAARPSLAAAREPARLAVDTQTHTSRQFRTPAVSLKARRLIVWSAVSPSLIQIGGTARRSLRARMTARHERARVAHRSGAGGGARARCTASRWALRPRASKRQTATGT